MRVKRSQTRADTAAILGLGKTTATTSSSIGAVNTNPISTSHPSDQSASTFPSFSRPTSIEFHGRNPIDASDACTENIMKRQTERSLPTMGVAKCAGSSSVVNTDAGSVVATAASGHITSIIKPTEALDMSTKSTLATTKQSAAPVKTSFASTSSGHSSVSHSVTFADNTESVASTTSRVPTPLPAKHTTGKSNLKLTSSMKNNRASKSDSPKSSLRNSATKPVAANSRKSTAKTTVADAKQSTLTTTNSPPTVREDRLSKELKNLDIQLTGYDSCIGTDARSPSGDMVIKASISEIVKTKSRGKGNMHATSPQTTTSVPTTSMTKLSDTNVEMSTNKSIASKTDKTFVNINVETNTDDDQLAKTNSVQDVGNKKKTTPNARKSKAASKNDNADQLSAVESVDNKKTTPKPKTVRKAKNQNPAQKRPTQTEEKTKTMSNPVTKPIVNTDCEKTKLVRSEESISKIVPVSVEPASSKPIPMARKRAPRPRKTPAKPRTPKVAKNKPIGMVSPNKDSTTIESIDQSIPEKSSPSKELPASPVPLNLTSLLPSYLHTPKDPFVYAHSPNFSDPDTVASPMIPEPIDCSTIDGTCSTGNILQDAIPKLATSGELHIKRMVQDILEGLEMSDECSMAIDKPFEEKVTGIGIVSDVEKAASLEVIDIKNVKVEVVDSMIKEKISVKSIESLTLSPIIDHVQLPDKAIVIKREHDASTKVSAVNASIKLEPVEKTVPISSSAEKIVPAPVECPKQTKDSNDIDLTPIIPSSEIPDSRDKDVYDFDESGHSSAETNISYKKSNKKDDPTNTSDAVIPATKTSGVVTPKRSVLKKSTEPVKRSRPTPATNSTSSSSSSSDDSDERVKSPRSRIKPKQRSTSTSTSCDSADDSTMAVAASATAAADDSDASGTTDTSVRTRVNNRRKSASKKRHIRMAAGCAQTSAEGPAKRHRMASLNALAKVQCLYENESRTAQELGFVREPRVAPRVRSVTIPEAGGGGMSKKEDAKAVASTSTATAEKLVDMIKEDGKMETKPASEVMTPPTSNPSTTVKKVAIKSKTDAAASKSVQSSDAAKTSTKTVDCTKATSSSDEDESSTSDADSKPEIKIDIDAPRALRTVPGLRGAGKLWEMGNMSSLESESPSEDDESYEEVSRQ